MKRTLVLLGMVLAGMSGRTARAESPLVLHAQREGDAVILGWNVGTDAFIVVKFDALPGVGSAVASAVEGQPASSVSVSLDGQAGYFAVLTGLRAVNFSDPDVESAVRAALDRKMEPTNRIYDAELGTIRNLDLSDRRIGDLGGLQYLRQATNLVLKSNGFTDLSPLAALQDLLRLEAGGNQLAGLPPLAQLANLTVLGLANNALSDISALSGLGRLRVLDLGDNQVRDITPLAGLSALEELYLDRNQVTDLGALAGLTSLRILDLGANPISDLGPLLQNARAGGFGDGDTVYLAGDTEVPESQVVALRGAGATVIFP